MRDARAVNGLLKMLDDDEVNGHAVIGLGRLKDERARSALEPFLHHPKAWIRQAAKQASAKIDRAAAKRRPTPVEPTKLS